MRRKLSIQNRYFFLWILFITIISACGNDGQKTAKDNTVVPRNISSAERVILPDTMEVYAPFKKYFMDSAEIARHSSLKVYSYVNVSCASCIAGIEKWDSVAQVFIKNKIPVILICYSKDNFELIKHLCEIGEVKHFSFPFYLDTQDRFSKTNPFFKEYVMDQTVLTDADNSVLLAGDPVHSQKTMELYMAEIEKRKRVVSMK